MPTYLKGGTVKRLHVNRQVIAAELPSFVVKQIHWDWLQDRPDSRYWSHVLEE